MENKYLIGIGIGVLVILFVVAGIFAFRSQRNQKPKPGTEQVTITVWRLFDKEEVFKPIFDDYLRDHKNVTIKYEKKNIADYEEVSTNAIAAGKGPDIWSIPNDWMVKHRDKLAPAPETLLSPDQYKGQFIDVVTQEGIMDNKIYGMPLYADSLGLYYNNEVTVAALGRLREKNREADLSKETQLLSRPPATWDDLVSVVKLVAQRDGNEVATTGLALGTAETTQNAPAILAALMLQNGTQMTNIDKTAASFHLPDKTQTGNPYYPGTEALDFYTAFAKPDRAVYNWNDRLGSSLEAFMNKKAAMMINFQYVQQDLKQRAPTLLYDVAPLPQIRGSTEPVNVASYTMETVTKNSAHPDVAWDLVKFMTDPTRASTYRSATRRLSAHRAQNEGNSDAFPTGIRVAKSVYKPDAKKYDETFKEMIRAVVDLKQPPQTAIDVAANKVTKLLLGQE